MRVPVTRILFQEKTASQLRLTLHSVEDADIVDENCKLNHAKTINFKRDDFEKLIENMTKLREVVEISSDGFKHDKRDETTHITGYRWLMYHDGPNARRVFSSREDCEEDFKCSINKTPACKPFLITTPIIATLVTASNKWKCSGLLNQESSNTSSSEL